MMNSAPLGALTDSMFSTTAMREMFSARACLQGMLDFEAALARAKAQSGVISAAADKEAAKFVHWGATSQDAIDTGLVLQLRGALDLIDADIAALGTALADLAQRHRDTLLAGRTWMQHALPVTFGLKIAGWLDAVHRHQERLSALRPRVLALQFGGAAGTLASLGPRSCCWQEAH